MGGQLDRRGFLGAGAALTAGVATAGPAAAHGARRAVPPAPRPEAVTIPFAVKYGMVAGEASMADKFRLLKDLGYDGVELNSPAAYQAAEVRAASQAAGLPVHGVVDSVHWNQRLSSPDAATRRAGIDALSGAIRDAHAFGGFSVLLVPGRVADPENENHDQVWERSIEGIREVLPLAAGLGVRILIENVWNGFCYDHDGPADQTAERLAAYLDAIGSPWVGAYFDIGNHQKYGQPARWIRTLGARIVKLDVKDWGVSSGWAKIGDGDVDWAAVRGALAEIGFAGWATAEVGGGDRARLEEIHGRMVRALRGG